MSQADTILVERGEGGITLDGTIKSNTPYSERASYLDIVNLGEGEININNSIEG